jgi:hypothetical protein
MIDLNRQYLVEYVLQGERFLKWRRKSVIGLYKGGFIDVWLLPFNDRQ